MRKAGMAFTLGVGFLVVSAAANAQTNTFPASGNVGIGTTAPVDYLQVSGDDPNKIALSILNSGSQASLSILAAGSSGFGINGWANAAVIEGESPDGLVLGSINRPGNGIGGPITFQINRASVAVINTNGNVGIGTTTPSAMLEVAGNVKLTSGSGASITFADGTAQSTAYTGVSCGGDFAESVDATGNRARYEPGDVLVLTSNGKGDVAKSRKPYSTLVAGIYSTKPGYVGRRLTGPKSPDELPMAMVGVVPTKVSAQNGPIHRGDLLVTASLPGYAMKGTDRSRMLGAVLGKAMGSLDSGTGVIEVLVTLQ